MNLFFVSLGCDKNLVDSEKMIALLASQNISVTSTPEDAEIIIVNTCGFIHDAKEESIEIMQADAERFKHMEREAVQLLNLVTGAEMEMDEEEEVVNVCKAIQDMRKEERELGQQEGKTQIIQSMLAHGYTLDEVMEVVGSDEDNVEEGKETGTMCKALEDMRKEERELGQQEGEQKGKQQIIRNMLLHNYAIADIMTLVECKEDEIIEVQKSMK